MSLGVAPAKSRKPMRPRRARGVSVVGPPLGRATRLVVGAASVAFVLLIWSILSGHHRPGGATLLPGPLDVIGRCASLLWATKFAGHDILQNAGASIIKFLRAFLLGTVLGIPLGLSAGFSKWFDHIVAPIIDLYRFIPPIAWVPFALLWFGTGPLAPTIVIFAGTFTPTYLNARAGARAIEPVLIRAAKSMLTGKWLLLSEVLLPGALPQVLAGLRVAAGSGWQSLVGAELIIGTSGLGYMIVQAQGGLHTKTVMSGMLAIGAIGALIDAGLRGLEKVVQNYKRTSK